VDCVIYARVSTKEQQEEGYSVPAQLKAIRKFCLDEGLTPQAQFIEAESAGKAGRTEFGRMLAYLKAHPEVRIVVAHKLDRLYRNYRDQIALEEELEVRVRYVVGDFPATPQGELVRDVQLGVAKYYLGNLREEVIKGMDEKVAQGGWPHRAPIGYLNERSSRSVVVDPVNAPLVVHAFERYSTGLVSLRDLADELHSLGLSFRGGGKLYPSVLHRMLTNPFYCGRIRYRGELYQGRHEALISEELFAEVQARFEPNRNGNKERRHVFTLRDFMYCADCGCKITAEKQRGHIYYRCTHGKGRDKCGQRTYTREELLMEQVEMVLSSIEIGPDIIEALVEGARILDAQEAEGRDTEREVLKGQMQALQRKAGKLIDAFLEGTVPADAYKPKADGLSSEIAALEQRLGVLADGARDTTKQVERLAKLASGARVTFTGAPVATRREVLATVVSNIAVQDGRIVDYQLKEPFDMLQMDASGTMNGEWWAR